jgi:hypothetical protein
VNILNKNLIKTVKPLKWTAVNICEKLDNITVNVPKESDFIVINLL